MIDEVHQELPVEGEGIEAFILGLVGAPETHEVGRHDARAARDEARDHAAVEVAPGRLAVQAEEGALALALVDVMDAPVAPGRVLRREGKAGEWRHARIVECPRWITRHTRISR